MTGMARRPTGITILAILAFVVGVFLLLFGAFAALVGGAVASVGGAALGGLVGAFGLLALVLGIVEILVGYGFWTLKSWAWPLGLAAAVATIGFSVLRIVGGIASIGSEIITIALAGAIIYYLLTPGVKKAFGRS